MHLRLLYATLLAFVFVCLQEIVALPTGNRWSGLERRMDAMPVHPKGESWAHKALTAATFLPKLGYQAFTVPHGTHASGTGSHMSDADVVDVFMPFFPLAQAAYGNPKHVEQVMKNYGSHIVHIGHVERDMSPTEGHPYAYGYVDTKKKVLLLFFAGTGSFADMLIDADGILTDPNSDHFETFANHHYPLHKGFMDVMTRVFAPKIKAWAREAIKEHEITGIVIAGHSFGGALSALAHMTLIDANLNVWVSTRSFAGPRVSTRDGADLFQEKYKDFRAYYLKKDPVGNFGGTGLGYNHPPQSEVKAKETPKGGVAHTAFDGKDDKDGVSHNSVMAGQQGVTDHGGPYNVFLHHVPPWGNIPITNPDLGEKGLQTEYHVAASG